MTVLADDVVVVTTEPFEANSLLVRTAAGGIILVDSPTTPADTARLLDWVEAHWGSRPQYALNSHWHADATAGNQELRARGVEVVSSEHTARLVVDKGAANRSALLAYFAEREPDTAAELEAWVPTPANRTVAVAERAELELAGERVWLVYAGPSHSADSIGIFFPDRRLLYGGCIVRSDGGAVLNRREGDFANWPRVLAAFAALEPTHVIPGHGKRFDPDMLPESIEVVEAIAAGRR